MLNTFVVHVENKPGVLTRVASLFRRRAFNIDSLTVGRTEKPEVSRMTIVVDADRDQALRVEANLYKLVNVLLVENITGKPSIYRDLAIIKISAPHDARSQILEVVNVFRARVVDFDTDSLTIEMTGSEEKIDRLLEVLRPYGILEMVRTGIVAMRRGTKVQQEAAAAAAGAAAGNGAATLPRTTTFRTRSKLLPPKPSPHPSPLIEGWGFRFSRQNPQ